MPRRHHDAIVYDAFSSPMFYAAYAGCFFAPDIIDIFLPMFFHAACRAT